MKRGNIETTLELVPIDAIDFNDTSFRFRLDIPQEELNQLKTSINRVGLQNPIKLRQKGDRYQIISGWSRLQALKEIGHLKVYAEVYRDITYRHAMMIAYSENNHRSNLSDLEKSNQLHALHQECNVNLDTLIELMGGKRQRVFDLLRLQSMDERIKKAVHTGELSLYAAVELHKYSDRNRADYVERAIREGWSVNRIKRERKMSVHPFEGVYSDEDLEETRGCFHALRYVRFPMTDAMRSGAWERIFKHDGVPGPHKCEVTATIRALDRKPPYVCHNDIKWVVVARGRIDPHGRDATTHARANEHIQSWPAWFFLCDECTKLVVPSVEYHENIPFVIPLLNHYGALYPTPSIRPFEPYITIPEKPYTFLLEKT